MASASGGPSQATLRTFITRGYNNGAWNGTHASGAIQSSLAAASALRDAIGYGLGSEIAISSIGGFNISAGETLARYTLYGDANLNGVVNFDDYALGMVNLEPKGSSPEGVINANIKELWNKAIPHLIMAASDEEFDQVYRTFLTQMDAAGAQQVEREMYVRHLLDLKKKGIR